MSEAADIWGRIFLDYMEGHREAYFAERDDGVQHGIDSIGGYFAPPRLEAELKLLARLSGPVLDLGAGAGSYALYLQSLGLDVTAADASPGALEVCRRRGCRSVRAMDLRALDLPPASFRSVIIMGNTLGAHQTPETLPAMLRAVRNGVAPGGHLLCTTRDPLDTDEPRHLAYHQRNRDRGLPPGLTRIRLKYRDITDDWIHLWMPTATELVGAASEAGWELLEELSEGPNRVRLFRATVTTNAADSAP